MNDRNVQVWAEEPGVIVRVCQKPVGVEISFWDVSKVPVHDEQLIAKATIAAFRVAKIPSLLGLIR